MGEAGCHKCCAVSSEYVSCEMLYCGWGVIVRCVKSKTITVQEMEKDDILDKIYRLDTTDPADIHNNALLCLLFISDWRICSPPYLEINSVGDISSIQEAMESKGLSFPLSQ